MYRLFKEQILLLEFAYLISLQLDLYSSPSQHIFQGLYIFYQYLEFWLIFVSKLLFLNLLRLLEVLNLDGLSFDGLLQRQDLFIFLL